MGNSIEKKVLDLAPESVFWTRKDGSFAYVNEAACTGLGYSRNELLKLQLFDIDTQITPEFWTAHWSSISQAAFVTLERLHRRHDGSIKPVEVNVRQIPTTKEVLHVSYVRDLTIERRIETARAEHVSYLDDLFNQSPVPQLIIDPETGSIMEANAAASIFYKYAPKKLCRMKIQQINRMSKRDIRLEMRRALAGKRFFFQFQHTDADEGVHDVRVFSVPVIQNGRQLLHSTILDVTESVKSHGDLLHQKSLLDRLPIGVYQSTPGADGLLLQANPAFRRIFGMAEHGEIVGRRMADLYVNPEERAEVSNRILEAGNIFRDVRQAKTESGRHIQIAISSQASRLADGSIVIEGAVEDVTYLGKAEIALARANSRTANALKAAPIPMLIYTPQGQVEIVNHAWCEITGYSPAQLTSLEDWTRLAYGRDAEAVRARIKNMIRTGERQSEGDFEIECANGAKRIWAFYSGPLEFEGGAPSLVLSAAIDVTQQRRNEKRMRQSNSIIESAHEGIAVTDSQRNIERVNAAFTRITGYRESEVLGENPRILSSGRHNPEFYEQMWSSVHKHGHWKGEIWNRRKNGEIYPEWLSVTEIRDEEGKIVNYVGMFNDLTELKRSQANIERLQRFDSLTGLPNQREFVQFLNGVIERLGTRPRGLTVIVCGLDRFRMVNESFSYLEGDRTLRIIAERLKQIQKQGNNVARTGGDHFAIVMGQGASRKGILDMVDRIAGAVAEPISTSGDHRLMFQCSIGIARFPDDGRQAEELLRNAETAMYQSKRNRAGSYTFYSSKHTETAQTNLSVETRMRKALDDHAFPFHLQPVVSINDGTVIGAEVLARWPVGDSDPVAPDVFIPVAERSGLITPLSFQLLKSSCRAAVEMKRNFARPFRLAFNVSALMLKDNRFDSLVLKQLKAAGLCPDEFEIELTESTLMQHVGGSSQVLKRLRKSGIRISIDDFGTGFSSLAYLQEIDAQALKIDRRFISTVGESKANAKIVESIIAMAHALGMDTIAEGVETPEQLEFLRRHGCDFFQGYLFSRPLPPLEFEKLYSSLG